VYYSIINKHVYSSILFGYHIFRDKVKLDHSTLLNIRLI